MHNSQTICLCKQDDHSLHKLGAPLDPTFNISETERKDEPTSIIAKMDLDFNVMPATYVCKVWCCNDFATKEQAGQDSAKTKVAVEDELKLLTTPISTRNSRLSFVSPPSSHLSLSNFRSNSFTALAALYAVPSAPLILASAAASCLTKDLLVAAIFSTVLVMDITCIDWEFHIKNL